MFLLDLIITVFVVGILSLLERKSDGDLKYLYFPVSLPKLAVMSLFSFGTYQLAWMYLNWRRVNANNDKHYRPLVRTVLAVFTIHTLFKEIRATGIKMGIGRALAAGMLAIAWILWLFSDRLPSPVSLLLVNFIFIPLVPVQSYVNALNFAANPECEKNDEFSGLNWLLIVVGGFLHLVFLYVMGPSLVIPFLHLPSTVFGGVVRHGLQYMLVAGLVSPFSWGLIMLAGGLLVLALGSISTLRSAARAAITPDLAKWLGACLIILGFIVVHTNLALVPFSRTATTGKVTTVIGTDASGDAQFGPYMAEMQRQIKRAWFPPKGNESKRVIVFFKIDRAGKISQLRIDHSSGVAGADQAALKAVENAAPFSPLPNGAPDHADIQFTFDYNTFAGKGKP